jgi:hypothetical protein
MTTEQEQVIEFLKSEGYGNLRVIEGQGICGTLDYVTTRGICCDMTEMSPGHRYCYQNRAEANKALEAWNGKGHPPGNWIKHKGVQDGWGVDELNPNWS